jgi:hypothetical protein
LSRARRHRIDDNDGLDPDRFRRHHCGQADTTCAEHNQPRIGFGSKNSEDRTRTRLETAPERRGDGEVDRWVDYDDVVRGGERVLCEARLPEERSEQASSVLGQRRGPVHPATRRVEQRATRTVGPMTASAMRALAAAAIAQQDMIAGCNPGHLRTDRLDHACALVPEDGGARNPGF